MLTQMQITSPASARTLLTEAQRRVAVGLAADDASQDTALADFDTRLSDAIAAECNVMVGAGGIPTLLQETVTETLRFVSDTDLVLGRRHNVVITSVTVDGVALSSGDYVVDSEAGVLFRICNDQPGYWLADKIVVVYQAGFAADAIPGDLQQAAVELMRLSWLDRTRNPSLKSERTEIIGVEVLQRDYWVGSIPGQVNAGPVPDIVAGRLQRFRNGSFA